jgi:hypothetical protein
MASLRSKPVARLLQKFERLRIEERCKLEGSVLIRPLEHIRAALRSLRANRFGKPNQYRKCICRLNNSWAFLLAIAAIWMVANAESRISDRKV